MRRSSDGFSLLELMIVVAIILILAAFTVPKLMVQVYAIRVRYAATDLSGVLQGTRMEAVRKNTYYSLQPVAGNPVLVQVVDRNSAVVNSVPPAVLGNGIAYSYGSGSGAPGESAFITSLNFSTAPSSPGLPSFNARGLPCVASGGTCSVTAGQGLVFFLSGTSAAGSLGWTAVAVTPSGHCEVFAYDGTNWSQQ